MNTVYQLKIVLMDSKPPIWRRILVKDNTSLGKLHNIIQAVMGWEDHHLHSFTINDETYGIPDPEWDDLSMENEKKYKLNQFNLAVKNKFTYEYDFGDSWEHIITVEKILESETNIKYPVCTGGALACPPEDCGGIWGYYDMLEILNDESHSGHESYLEWLGGEFDPAHFSLEEANGYLKRLQR